MGMLSSEREQQMAELTADGPEDFEEFEALRADEQATPEEEVQMAEAATKLVKIMADDSMLPRLATALHKDRRGLMEVVPDILEPVLLKIYGELQAEAPKDQPVSSAIFFGEGGLLQMGVEEMFGLAQELQIPGADDPDQISGALIGIYKKTGEHVLRSKDGESMREVISLGTDMVAEGEGMPGDIKGAIQKLKKSQVSEGVEKGLLA